MKREHLWDNQLMESPTILKNGDLNSYDGNSILYCLRKGCLGKRFYKKKYGKEIRLSQYYDETKGECNGTQ